MKSFFALALCAATVMACAPAVTVAPPSEPVIGDVAMTPVQRASDGMVVAHGRLSGWGPGPASLPPGAEAIVLDGDPTKAQLFTLRVKFPHNYMVPPHFHSAWEHVTVISGLLHLGMGETVNMASAIELRPGSFIAIPSGHRHYAHSVGETVIQLHGMGPWTVTYVNRADDPRNR